MKTNSMMILRKDKTVEPDKNGKYPVRLFRCRLGKYILPSHKIAAERIF